MKIYPAILSDSIKTVQQQLLVVNSLDGVESIQVDVIDGYYADNLTITPADLLNLQFGESDLKIDFHLMVDEPMNFLNEIIEYKEYLPVEGVVAQIERMGSQYDFLDMCEKHGLAGGLSVDYFTPLSELDIASLRLAKKIQLMAIEAGFQDQVFKEQVFDKIEAFSRLTDQQQPAVELLVDGGIKEPQLSKLSRLGVDAVVIGSWLWKNDKPQTVVDAVINK